MYRDKKVVGVFVRFRASTMKHAAFTARRDLGLRTIFNISPLTSRPEQASRVVVFSQALCRPLAEMLHAGSQHV
jgi:anthranilate phosphoribosyltransferase